MSTRRRFPFAGPLGWARAFGLLLRWELLSHRQLLPMMVFVQLLAGAGVVVGLGFLFDEVPPLQAAYLTAGSAVIALLMLGLVAAPQMISQHKAQKTYDLMLALPLPRPVYPLAGLTVWSLIALPGMVLALLVAAWHYDVTLTFNPLLVPTVALTLLVATSIGFAFAHASPHPMMTWALTQILAFGILVYSPINFPADRLPGWLQTLHAYLPFEHAATLVRGCLIPATEANPARSMAVLAAWTAGSWIVTLWIFQRRR
jgi:ABC-2 type transport system permease protein